MKLVEIRGELYEEVECRSVTGFSCSMCAFNSDCSNIACCSEKDVFYRKPVKEFNGKQYIIHKYNPGDCSKCCFNGEENCTAPSNCAKFMGFSVYFTEKEDNNKMETKNMKTEKRVIELNKPEIVDGKIKVTIKHQSHIGAEFGNTDIDSEKSLFIASNGVELCSFRYPWYAFSNRVYTRGTLNTKKNAPIKFLSLTDYNRFIEAVNEYNEFEFVIKEPMPKLKNKQYIKLSNGKFGFIVDNIVVYTTEDCSYDYISDIEDKIVGVYELYGTDGVVCSCKWKNGKDMTIIWEK